MGVYTKTILSLSSENVDFIDNLFMTVAPRPPPSLIQNIVTRILREEHVFSLGLMEYLLPMPAHLEQTVTNGYSGASPEWREWRLEHWGCPADAGLDLCERFSEHEVKLHFTSYNGDVKTGLTTASKIHGFQFVMLYHCDHGGVGICTENNNTCYEFPGLEPPVRSGIPNILIESFDLNRLFENYVRDC